MKGVPPLTVLSMCAGLMVPGPHEGYFTSLVARFVPKVGYQPGALAGEGNGGSSSINF